MKGILFKPWKIKFIGEHPDMEIHTRRVEAGLKEINKEPDKWEWNAWQKSQMWCSKFDSFWFDKNQKRIEVKPRYKVGETVYIKEAWGLAINDHGHNCLCYKSTNDDDMALDKPQMMRLWNHETKQWILEQTEDPYWYPDRWRSPLFMPAWAARHFIKITSVNPQRLQEITYDEILAEGWEGENSSIYIPINPYVENSEDIMNAARYWFWELWNSINPDYPFEMNPWVFDYGFEKCCGA